MTRLAALLFLVYCSLGAQTPPGQLIDVGAYRVHVYCTGTGTPTVILIGAFSFDWALVQPELAKSTRVCSYDPSGNAFSDPGPVATCEGRVDEIHRLLTSAHIDPPYVFAESARNLHRWAMSRNPERPTAALAEACIAALQDATPGHLPLVVVSTANDSPGYANLQTSLLALSPNSRHMIADRSFHSIEISQPAIVIDAIRQAIEATRK